MHFLIVTLDGVLDLVLMSDCQMREGRVPMKDAPAGNFTLWRPNFEMKLSAFILYISVTALVRMDIVYLWTTCLHLTQKRQIQCTPSLYFHPDRNSSLGNILNKSTNRLPNWVVKKRKKTQKSKRPTVVLEGRDGQRGGIFRIIKIISTTVVLLVVCINICRSIIAVCVYSEPGCCACTHACPHRGRTRLLIRHWPLYIKVRLGLAHSKAIGCYT